MNYWVMPGITLVPIRRTPEVILNILLDYFKIELEELKRKTRKRRMVTTRYIMFYYLYKMTDVSLNEIAIIFSPAVTDHTTVIHGIRFIKEQMSSKFDNDIKEHIENIPL